MNRNTTTTSIRDIMIDFANLTGLEPANVEPRRYLWTDAFAICNYLELFSRTNDETYKDLTLQLVDQVHHNLGRYRVDSSRSGWISGLDEKEGEQHPTRMGLRIGKQLDERKSNEPFNERLEWDRDGQYYHYLTKWMHALNCMSKATKEPKYINWAIELAKVAHRKFTYVLPNSDIKRMYWKMSIDLSYPLVRSMGQHDPLDGLVTYSELQATANREFKESSSFNLEHEIVDMAEICQGLNLTTSDPLGVGGLLFDASRIAQLIMLGVFNYESLLENVLDSSLVGLEAISRDESLLYPAEYSAVESLQNWIEVNPEIFRRKSGLKKRIEDIASYVPLKETIEQFWINDKNREANTWTEHREINMVMLATSLAPGGFLTI
jgi:hypothetical protein